MQISVQAEETGVRAATTLKALLQRLQGHLQVVASLLLRELRKLHQTRVLPLVIISNLKGTERTEDGCRTRTLFSA